jgi:hypothetical protein
MPMMKCSSHIQTSRNIKSFRSGRFSTGVPMVHIDLQRVCMQGAALAGRKARFSWLARQVREHTERYWTGRLRFP